MTMRVRRLDSNRDMTFGHGTDNYAATGEATVQRVKARLLTLRYEWYLDTSAGVPWFNPGPDGAQVIMGGPRNLALAEAEIKKCILESDGVSSIQTFSIAFNSSTRKLTVTANVISDDGDVFQIIQVSP